MRTRFAPSPTGPLHIGHAYAALVAEDLAKVARGTFLVRIEDIDQSRCRPEWENMIFEDLEWLGVRSSPEIMRQSERMERYRDALQTLWQMGVLYPCTCRRRDILAATSAPQEGAPLHGPDGVIYPGTCRNRHDRSGDMPADVPLRLDMARALDRLAVSEINFKELGPYQDQLTTNWIRKDLIDRVGDIVLSRREMGTSYHLSVVLDDHDQQITLVTRGADLADATSIHVVLQRLLDLSSCNYHHHRLIRDDNGTRLAKRDDARSLRAYRAEWQSPKDIRDLVEFKPLAP